MKKIALIFAALLIIGLFLQHNISAQVTPPDGWIRVHSDNAEFSVEIPASYNYFYDEDGLLLSKEGGDYNLQKMNLLNAYFEDTLISFETYKSGKGGAGAIYEKLKESSNRGGKSETSDFERDGAKIKQIIVEESNYFYVLQYFNSKSYVYILTAASRTGDNKTIRRFLDSLIFRPETKETPAANSVPFSVFKASPIKFTTVKEDKDEQKPLAIGDKAVIAANDKTTKIIFVYKDTPSYVEAARKKGVKGKIKLRATFGEKANISEIAVIKSLPEGLLRQAVLSTLRIKFLPQQENGKPISVSKTIEYGFDIY